MSPYLHPYIRVFIGMIVVVVAVASPGLGSAKLGLGFSKLRLQVHPNGPMGHLCSETLTSVYILTSISENSKQDEY